MRIRECFLDPITIAAVINGIINAIAFGGLFEPSHKRGSCGRRPRCANAESHSFLHSPHLPEVLKI
ncbi:hypothetical protein BJP36_44205 [Moorena producens JHB]|uniref:Uncharacterized protein n=1 Tax=Moorena producens (strain JHB) TaxID=1454205 RepID=A0A9Q9UW00_MOOP1|nr:hypothetical protein [Moorena producens]WAN69366.1 hypothetical protein BJP36_44205 [Moorena producens JHB]